MNCLPYTKFQNPGLLLIRHDSEVTLILRTKMSKRTKLILVIFKIKFYGELFAWKQKLKIEVI